MTPSEERLQRYSQIEREADALGRVIGVKRLNRVAWRPYRAQY
jgi:hypothetical protein